MRPEHLDLLHTPSRPAVHPDGTWAVVAMAHPDLEEDTYPSRLWRLELADGSMRPLTHGTGDSEPVISPDGRYVAFIRAPKGDKPQLALMPTDGGEPQVLTDHPSGVSGRPDFSPDSRRIAYCARVPEEGRYGTTEGVGPDAEPPRHITRFTYRMDGLGFSADRPQHLYVIQVPVQDDPTAPESQTKSAAAADDDAARQADGDTAAGGASGEDDGDAQGTEADGPGTEADGPGTEADGALGARAGVPAHPVQVTGGDGDHRDPVWDHEGTHLLAIRAVIDELRGEVIRVPVPVPVPAGADADVEVLDGPEHGASVVRTGANGAVWLLAQDLGSDGMDFIGKTPALYSARLTAEGLSDLQRCTDPRTESFNAGVFLVEDGAEGAGQVLLSRYHRGATDLVRYAGGAVRPVFEGQVSVSGAAVLPAGKVLVTAATPDSAGEVFLLDEASADEPVRRLTDFGARLREQADPFIPRELQVDGEDGYPVHGWVTVPHGQGPHPVLLLIHGGPYAQYEAALFDEVQVYTRAGYAVVFCNPRGSSGYGQDHGRAIIEGFGDRDAADVLAFLDGALAAHPEFDAERVGVLGGSYGGYMTAWLTTRTDRFVAAIVERGFLDPVSFEGSSDIGWFFGLKYLGEDPAGVAAQSPMAHIDKVSTPTLVIHSEHDWRTPVEQGQRWFVGLKRRGVETEFLLFPGATHGLSRTGRPKHRKARFEHILTWWQRHLPVR